jgi:CelD/BcsL family acetyltransferase involved in cellulose biosynthesis
MRVWWNHYAGEDRLHLLSAWGEGGRLVGLAPLCRRVSPAGPLQWIGDGELADALDFIIWRGMEGPVFTAMDQALRRSAVSFPGLVLHFIPEDSPTLEEANGLLQGGWDAEMTLEESSPRVRLPGSWEAFLHALSGRHRHEIRRKLGRIQRELQPRFRVVEDEAHWEEAIQAFFRLHRLSQVQKARFMTPEREGFFREMGRAFLEDGSLRLVWVEAGGRPIASSLSFVYGRTWGLYNSGYDPAYRAVSPGFVLVAHTIQMAIQEGLEFYDFLKGREGYKYDFGAQDRDLYCLRLSPPGGGEA